MSRKPQLTIWCVLVFLVSGFGGLLRAQDEKAESTTTPQVFSIFPSGGQKGTSLQAEVRGKNLGEAYAVWSGTPGLKASLRKVEEIAAPQGEKTPATGSLPGPHPAASHRALLQVEIDPSAKIGAHSLRLVSSAGVSNALKFFVNSESLIAESKDPHNEAHEAQVVNIPCVVAGRISNRGDLDYYAFEVSKGQEIAFRVISSRLTRQNARVAAQLALYKVTGSWFDPNRATRLASSSSRGRFIYKFGQEGRYVVKVSSFLGTGGPDFTYQLRIVPIEALPKQELRTARLKQFRYATPWDPSKWEERAWDRRLEGDRLSALVSRAVVTDELREVVDQGLSSVLLVKESATGSQQGVDLTQSDAAAINTEETRPNGMVGQAVELKLPALVEGTIEKPGDVHTFKFHVKAGEQLAFELETPDLVPPDFNPHLVILDSDGKELFANIHRWVSGAGNEYAKEIQPKTIHAFPRQGAYTLKIGDITSRHGNPHFTYRLLIRPQIPHVGKVELSEDHINLVAGEASKLTLISDLEEGLSGGIAFAVENLPAGVQALPSAALEPDKLPPADAGRRDLYLPKTEKIVIMLLGSENAPLTEMPQMVRISARPVVQGKLGAPVIVREFPLMVIRPSEDTKASAGLREENN